MLISIAAPELEVPRPATYGSRRVALICMPFASTYRPSIQVGLLKGLAEKTGWKADTYHFNLDFAALVGLAEYEQLSQHRGIQLGDWLFSVAAFGDTAPDADGRLIGDVQEELQKLLRSIGRPDDFDWLRRLRQVLVPAFLTTLGFAVDWSQYDVIGFTSTFQQTVPAIALARALKRDHAAPLMLFGGANFEGEMGLELMRSVPDIDAAVIGEADEAFPALLDALARGSSWRSIPGVATRNRDGQVRHQPATAPYSRLDELPVPDYDEYFERAERLSLTTVAKRTTIAIPFESARGCWWGEKQHCVFCGLNSETMKFRAKSPARMLEELNTLSRRYKTFQFEAVDNIIPHEYFRDVRPSLNEQHSWRFFYEIKSNLDRARIKILAEAGVKRIQPGIESLSTPVLKLMKKGVRAIQNVNLLRWCAYYGVRVSWNMLWGFPGEKAEHYAEQARLVRNLKHLEPPGGAGRIWLERFSPLYARRGEYQFDHVEPEQSYKYVFPSGTQLDRVAYFFSYHLRDALPDAAFAELLQEVQNWRQSSESKRPFLRCRLAPGIVRIEDSREEEGIYQFEGALAAIYTEAFWEPVSIARIQKAVADEYQHSNVEQVISDLCDAGLMMRDEDSILALAVLEGK